MAGSIAREVQRGRGRARSEPESIMAALVRMPWPFVALAMQAFHLFDGLNILPARLVRADPMYASALVANLGSVGISSAYHSLYEHGVTPLSIVIGEFHQVPVVAGSRVEPRRVATLKYSYDGRVEDGWYCARFARRMKQLLEEPECLAAGPRRNT